MSEMRLMFAVGLLLGWGPALESHPPAAAERLTPGRRRRLLTILKRQDALSVLVALATDAMSGGRGMSLNRLASQIAPARVSAASNTLRDLLLPALSEVGWVEGLAQQPLNGRQTHELRITDEGAAVLSQHLRSADGDSQSNHARIRSL